MTWDILAVHAHLLVKRHYSPVGPRNSRSEVVTMMPPIPPPRGKGPSRLAVQKEGVRTVFRRGKRNTRQFLQCKKREVEKVSSLSPLRVTRISLRL
jgi:hypothetical protein